MRVRLALLWVVCLAGGANSARSGGDWSPHQQRPSRASRMLQVDCEVEGESLTAFVDTGAQVTVMSLDCARRCGLMPLCDDKYAGTAVGVGSTRIVGRINKIDIKIGRVLLRSHLTILENMDLDMLIGMDVLRRYQCEICLKDNELRFRSPHSDTDVTIPFLTDDSPSRARTPFPGRNSRSRLTAILRRRQVENSEHWREEVFRRRPAEGDQDEDGEEEDEDHDPPSDLRPAAFSLEGV